MFRNPCISLQHRAELSHSLGMARFRIELEELPRDDGEGTAFDLDHRFVQFCVGFFDTAAGEMTADVLPRQWERGLRRNHLSPIGVPRSLSCRC